MPAMQAKELSVLVQLLQPSNSPRVQDAALDRLHKASKPGSRSSEENLRAMVTAGIAAHLVPLVRSRSASVCNHTACLLGLLTMDQQAREQALAAGCIPALVQQMAGWTQPGESVAWVTDAMPRLLRQLVQDQDSCAAAVEAGALPALTGLLRMHSAQLQPAATDAVMQLAVVAGKESMHAIAAPDVLAAVVKVLHGPYKPEQLHALTALTILIASDHAEATVAAGVIKPAARLLRSKVMELRAAAAEALARLNDWDDKLGIPQEVAGASQALVQLLSYEHVNGQRAALMLLTHIAAKTGAFSAIAKAGGPAAAGRLLHSSNPGVQGEALQALMIFRHYDQPAVGVAAAGGAKALVKMLQDKTTHARMMAAELLTIALHQRCNTQALLEAGAVPALIPLLRSAHLDLRGYAAASLGALALDSPACQQDIIAGGALPVLVRMLQREDDLEDVPALWTVAVLATHMENLHALVSAPGLLPTLVELLYHDDQQVQRHAMTTLSALAYHSLGTDQHQPVGTALMSAGAVPGAVHLLKHSSCSHTLANAGTLLASVGQGRADAKAAIIAAGALEPLNHLLLNSECEKVRDAAFAALLAAEGHSRAQERGERELWPAAQPAGKSTPQPCTLHTDQAAGTNGGGLHAPCRKAAASKQRHKQQSVATMQQSGAGEQQLGAGKQQQEEEQDPLHDLHQLVAQMYGGLKL